MRAHLEALAASDLRGLSTLFAPGAVVASPLYGADFRPTSSG
jgi:hypothetical protein